MYRHQQSLGRTRALQQIQCRSNLQTSSNYRWSHWFLRRTMKRNKSLHRPSCLHSQAMSSFSCSTHWLHPWLLRSEWSTGQHLRSRSQDGDRFTKRPPNQPRKCQNKHATRCYRYRLCSRCKWLQRRSMIEIERRKRLLDLNWTIFSSTMLKLNQNYSHPKLCLSRKNHRSSAKNYPCFLEEEIGN